MASLPIPAPNQPPPGYTLEDALVDLGRPIPERVRCPNCGIMVRAAEISPTREQDEELKAPWSCGTCQTDGRRRKQRKKDQEAAAAVPPWETPQGLELKAQRVQLLDAHAWTYRADSPLTKPNQAAWLAWAKKLHRMTVEHSTPKGFKFPDPPPLVYATDE